MSANYHIEQPVPGSNAQTARDQLALIAQLFSPPEGLADKVRGRNVLTRTVDRALVVIRNYLLPIHWLFVAITAAVLFLYVQIVAVTAHLITSRQPTLAGRGSAQSFGLVAPRCAFYASGTRHAASPGPNGNHDCA